MLSTRAVNVIRANTLLNILPLFSKTAANTVSNSNYTYLQSSCWYRLAGHSCCHQEALNAHARIDNTQRRPMCFSMILGTCIACPSIYVPYMEVGFHILAIYGSWKDTQCMFPVSLEELPLELCIINSRRITPFLEVRRRDHTI